MTTNKELVEQLIDELNKSAEEYYKDVVVPLRDMIRVLKAEKLALQEESQKLKQIIESTTKKPIEVYFNHLDAERYRSIIQKKELEIIELKKEIQKLRNPEISRYTINVKRRKK